MNLNDLLMYANSMYVTHVVTAINDENCTVEVLEKALNNYETGSNARVLASILNSPVLNQDIFNKVFENSKDIYGESEIRLLIITNPFFTVDMYNYYINRSNFIDASKLLINSKYASAEAYIKIIENCYNAEDSFFETVINGRCFNSDVLKKLIDYVKQNDKILCMCLDNVFMNEEILGNIIDVYASYWHRLPETTKKIFTHNKLTKDLILKIIKKVNSRCIANYKTEIFDSSLCDSDVLKEMGKDDYFFDDVLNHKNVNSDVLIFLLDECNDRNSICKCIDSPAFNEDVAIKVVERFSTFRHYDVEDNIIELIKNPIMTEKILMEIVNRFDLYEIKQAVLGHPLATKKLKIAILINNSNLTDEQIDEFFNIENLTEEDVIAFVNAQYKHIKVLEKAKDFPGATQELYRSIILAIYENEKASGSGRGEYLLSLLDKDLDETTLTMMAKRTQNPDILKKILEHENAGLKIVAVTNVVSDKFQNEQKNLLDMAKDLKQRIISQIYQIEEEENVTEILRMNVQDRMSTMLWGPSGVGKSSRVFQVDPTATLLILKNGMLPEEVIGGKEPNGEPGEIYPPHWYNVLCEKCNAEPDRMHILFIDEFTNVSDTIKNLVWEVIGNRLVNGHEEWPLPENCAIVVAGNRPEESSAVRVDSGGGVMPAPLHNRINSMLEIEFDIDEWQKWALETDVKTGNLRIHPIVYSFCMAHADKVMFTQFNPEKITQAFLSPRKWETLSNALYSAEKRGENCHISYARIMSILGDPEIANAFISHYERLPLDMDKIIRGEYTEEDFATIEDKLYALGTVIAKYEGDEIAIESFIIDCLGDEYLSVYNNMKEMRNSIMNDNKIEFKNKNM